MSHSFLEITKKSRGLSRSRNVSFSFLFILHL